MVRTAMKSKLSTLTALTSRPSSRIRASSITPDLLLFRVRLSTPTVHCLHALLLMITTSISLLAESIQSTSFVMDSFSGHYACLYFFILFYFFLMIHLFLLILYATTLAVVSMAPWVMMFAISLSGMFFFFLITFRSYLLLSY